MSAAGGAAEAGKNIMSMMRPSVHRVRAMLRGGDAKRWKKKLPEPFTVWKIVRGDKVEVISGKEKGKQGTIIKVHRKVQRVIIEGLNLVKKHIKRQGESAPGRIITKEAPMHYSNVMLVDPTIGKPTRIKMGFLDDGSKVRISKKTGVIIPKPDMSHVTKDKPIGLETKDTPGHIVHKSTVSDEDRELHRQLRELNLNPGVITSPSRLGYIARMKRLEERKLEREMEKKALEKARKMLKMRGPWREPAAANATA